MSLQPLVIAIEGNIGAGKTTLLRQLAALTPAAFSPRRRCSDRGDGNEREWPDKSQTVRRVEVLLEPVEAWTRLLGLYYAAPRAHALPFQMHVLWSRWQQLREALARCEAAGGEGAEGEAGGGIALLLCERSLLADCRVFATLQHDLGILDDDAFGVYKEWFDAVLATDARLTPAGVVYLRAPPALCLERIAARDRPGEAGKVSEAYLEGLHARHEAWLLQRPRGREVCVVEVGAGGAGDGGDGGAALAATVAFVRQFVRQRAKIDGDSDGAERSSGEYSSAYSSGSNGSDSA
jgi:deoxyadenosine/deoxycytidine kinase